MRELLAARSDRDFVVTGPSRRSASSPKGWERAARAVLTHPKEALGAAVLAGAALTIIVNAVALQTARHPAPVPDQAAAPRAEAPTPIPPARPVAPAPVAVLPQPRSVTREPVNDPVRTGEIPAPPARVSPPLAPSKPAAARDPIGDLIRSAEVPVPPAPVGRPDPQRTIAAGQRALSKLGYGPLKPDGIMGPGTRQAIERFERDRRLPVSGEFSLRTARELSAQSGIAIE